MVQGSNSFQLLQRWDIFLRISSHSRTEHLDLSGTPAGVHFQKAHQKVWICYWGVRKQIPTNKQTNPNFVIGGKKTLEELPIPSSRLPFHPSNSFSSKQTKNLPAPQQFRFEEYRQHKMIIIVIKYKYFLSQHVKRILGRYFGSWT